MIISLSQIKNKPSYLKDISNINVKRYTGWIEAINGQSSLVISPYNPIYDVNLRLQKCSIIMLSHLSSYKLISKKFFDFNFNLNVSLQKKYKSKPITLFLPFRQPVPNSEIFYKHVLLNCRRLICYKNCFTVILLDDLSLRYKLLSILASEFGRRVVHEYHSISNNTILFCSNDWWLLNNEVLPDPKLIIMCILPLKSLSDPVTLKNINVLKSQKEDWFRDYLLNHALIVMPHLIEPLRRSKGVLAVLDGRVRSRSWGERFLSSIEPWIPLKSLVP